MSFLVYGVLLLTHVISRYEVKIHGSDFSRGEGLILSTSHCVSQVLVFRQLRKGHAGFSRQMQSVRYRVGMLRRDSVPRAFSAYCKKEVGAPRDEHTKEVRHKWAQRTSARLSIRGGMTH